MKKRTSYLVPLICIFAITYSFNINAGNQKSSGKNMSVANNWPYIPIPIPIHIQPKEGAGFTTDRFPVKHNYNLRYKFTSSDNNVIVLVANGSITLDGKTYTSYETTMPADSCQQNKKYTGYIPVGSNIEIYNNGSSTIKIKAQRQRISTLPQQNNL